MDLHNDSAVVSKICGMFIFTFTALILGLLPMIIHAHFKRKFNTEFKRKYKWVLSCMTAVGGGVLLSTTFLHLLPEIRESTELLREKQYFTYKESVQLPELLMCLGFLLLYLIEEIADRFVDTKHKTIVHTLNIDTLVNNDCIDPVSSISSINGQTMSEDVQECVINNVSYEDCKKEAMDKLQTNVTLINHEGRRIHHCQKGSTIFFTESSGKNFLLIFALSIHEAFEGLAIGLERQPDAVWYMVLAVGTHKAIIALCIGIQMLNTKLDRKLAIIYVFVFATATSFGVALGLFMYMESGGFSVILQGLATGTLLHVVFFELLKPHSNGTPFIGVFLGFMCMAVLKYFSP